MRAYGICLRLSYLTSPVVALCALTGFVLRLSYPIPPVVALSKRAYEVSFASILSYFPVGVLCALMGFVCVYPILHHR